MRVDGVFVEVKRTTASTLNTLKHAVDNASKQADNVVIVLMEDADKSFLNRVTKGRFKDHKDLKVIEFKLPDGSHEVFER